MDKKPQLGTFKEAVKHRVEVLVAWLGLQAHEVTISEHPADEDDYASVEIDPDYLRIVVRLNATFESVDPVEQDATLVHEVFHALFRRVRDAYGGMTEFVGITTFMSMERTAQAAEEWAVTTLERAFAKNAPDGWPPEKKLDKAKSKR